MKLRRGQAWLAGIAPEASEELRARWLRRAHLALAALDVDRTLPGSAAEAELLDTRERDALSVIEEWS